MYYTSAYDDNTSHARAIDIISLFALCPIFVKALPT